MAALDWVSSSSASTTRSSSYAVFLSFRGEDTRSNFTSFLYKALKDKGINVFMDSQVLKTGDAIDATLLREIEGSTISIPIFSEGYADSKWCLMELTQMVQCHRSKHQMILPIFFHIDPSHVRNQTGSFEKAFQKHEKKFKADIVKNWRDALRVVGNLKGEVLDKIRDQAEVVDLIVKKALRELISSTHLAECKYPIGIDSHVDHLLSLLSTDSNDVQFVGICGFGGIGKTTIAKVVYNRILKDFNRHSFLSDVREQATQCRGLVSLQNRLLQDILKREDIDVDNCDKGKILIEQLLCKEKVLLVFDDVDSQEQVHALAGGLNWFGCGSKVIITTRDESILNVAKVDKDRIYKPQVLDCEQSLQLFSWHAFQNDQPPEAYMQLSREVACQSRGLPLTLEVLGSCLSGNKDKKFWESTLQRLKDVPHEKVQKQLKISYDNLEDDYQKAMFLDAACLFVGWEKETVISIWEACGYYPHSTIPILIKRSLLKFEGTWSDKFYYLRMHDQIRDMGRKIVKEENPMEPSKRSRLWSNDDIKDVLKEHKGTEMIEGLGHRSSFFHFNAKDFRMMPNLRFFYTYLANIERDFSCLPSGLRWFRWNNCPILPTNFYHNSLVYLDLSHSDFQRAWNIKPRDENEFQKLKTLDLSKCAFLSKSPNFSWFPYLERLNLGECKSLDKLDESIGQLINLKSLILSGCWRIKELPKSIGDLKFLVKLDLSWTMIEELPNSFSKLNSLQELNLKFCELLKKLPEFIGDLKSLVELHLCDCFEIAELPDSFGFLEKLEVLDACGCYRLAKLPRSMQGMKSLHSINLKETKISKLPDDFSRLPNSMELKMSWWLQSLPADVSYLKKLKQLGFYECKNLENLPEHPPSLVQLYCPHRHSMVLPDLSRLKILTVLDDCEEQEEIQGLEGTKPIEDLDATGGYNLAINPRGIHAEGNRIMLIVFEFPSNLMDCTNLQLDISASIHQEDKTIRCLHTLRIEEDFGNGDTIYINHLNGFDWFGIPLQEDDAIEILYITGFYLKDGKRFRVKFYLSYVANILRVSAPSTSCLIDEFQMPFDKTNIQPEGVPGCSCYICLLLRTKPGYDINNE